MSLGDSGVQFPILCSPWGPLLIKVPRSPMVTMHQTRSGSIQEIRNRRRQNSAAPWNCVLVNLIITSTRLRHVYVTDTKSINTLVIYLLYYPTVPTLLYIVPTIGAIDFTMCAGYNGYYVPQPTAQIRFSRSQCFRPLQAPSKDTDPLSVNTHGVDG